jgi:hypothetical protein
MAAHLSTIGNSATGPHLACAFLNNWSYCAHPAQCVSTVEVVRTIAAVAALLSIALVAGCGGERESEALPTETAASPPAQSSGPPAPTIEGETIDGERIALEDFRGKPVLVNVWSSW